MLLVCMSVLLSSCKNNAYNYNNGVAPTGISYSYYKYGTGTSPVAGALIINVHSSSTSTYNEYYTVNIFGLGSYNLQPGTVQVFIPDVWANYYDFTVQKFCGPNNTTCIPRTLTGTAIITTEITTVADVWL